MHGVCWDLGSPWLSGRSALCTAMPVLKTLFWGLWLFSVLTSNLMCFFCYFFQLRISCLFFLSLSFYPFLFFFLHLLSPFPLSPFSLLFTCHPCLPASSSLCHAGQQVPGQPGFLLPSCFPPSSFSHAVLPQDSDWAQQTCVLAHWEEASNNKKLTAIKFCLYHWLVMSSQRSYLMSLCLRFLDIKCG